MNAGSLGRSIGILKIALAPPGPPVLPPPGQVPRVLHPATGQAALTKLRMRAMPPGQAALSQLQLNKSMQQAQQQQQAEQHPIKISSPQQASQLGKAAFSLSAPVPEVGNLGAALYAAFGNPRGTRGSKKSRGVPAESPEDLADIASIAEEFAKVPTVPKAPIESPVLPRPPLLTDESVLPRPPLEAATKTVSPATATNPRMDEQAGRLAAWRRNARLGTIAKGVGLGAGGAAALYGLYKMLQSKEPEPTKEAGFMLPLALGGIGTWLAGKFAPQIGQATKGITAPFRTWWERAKAKRMRPAAPTFDADRYDSPFLRGRLLDADLYGQAALANRMSREAAQMGQ